MRRRLRKAGGPASALKHTHRKRGVVVCFRVAMLSLHTSPLALLGRTRDAGGMNVYVRELSREALRVPQRPDGDHQRRYAQNP